MLRGPADGGPAVPPAAPARPPAIKPFSPAEPQTTTIPALQRHLDRQAQAPRRPPIAPGPTQPPATAASTAPSPSAPSPSSAPAARRSAYASPVAPTPPPSVVAIQQQQLKQLKAPAPAAAPPPVQPKPRPKTAAGDRAAPRPVAMKPAELSRGQVVEAVMQSPVTIVTGDTGCGKTSLVPQFILDAGILPPGRHIVCTQPRRISAITMAEYVARQRGTNVGREVGFQIRFVNRTSEETRLVYATTAIILRRLHADPTLQSIGCLIVDEVHERDLYSELLLLCVRNLLLHHPSPHLRVVLMSATLNANLFADYFADCCPAPLRPIHVGGQMYPVSEYFLEEALEWTGCSVGGTEAPAAKEAPCPCAANGRACDRTAGRCAWAGYDPRECLAALQGRCPGVGCGLMHAAPKDDPRCPCAFQRGQCTMGSSCRFQGHAPNECFHFLIRGQCRDGLDRCPFLHRSVGATAVDVKKEAAVREALRRAGKQCSDATIRSLCLWKEREIHAQLVVELVRLFDQQETTGKGSILVFLPGWNDIVKVQRPLEEADSRYWILPLHSMMTAQQQHRAFEKPPPGRRKLILSTNIAETSVTIDDVMYVIDTGVMKERMYDAERNVSTLEVSLITAANATQRRGRAGRCQVGVVVHLFPSYRLQELKESPLPEILSKPLEEVVLQCKVILEGDVTAHLRESLACPGDGAVLNAIALLQEMNALTIDGSLTALGRAIAALPVHPMVAKMLLYAAVFRVLKPVAVIAAFLSLKSPFAFFAGKVDESEIKRQFAHGMQSDHLPLIQAYSAWRQVPEDQQEAFCDQHGLSHETMQMAELMVAQFVQVMRGVGYDGADCHAPASPSDDTFLAPLDPKSTEFVLVKAALCAGFYPNVVSITLRGTRWMCMDDSRVDVQLHRASVNHDQQAYRGQWLVHTDSMKLTRVNVMSCTVVEDAYALLFCNRLRDTGSLVTLDRWQAFLSSPSSKLVVAEAFKLRKEMYLNMRDCLRQRNISVFPYAVVEKVLAFLQRPPAILLSRVDGTRVKRPLEVVAAPLPSKAARLDPTESAHDWAEAERDDGLFPPEVLKAACSALRHPMELDAPATDPAVADPSLQPTPMDTSIEMAQPPPITYDPAEVEAACLEELSDCLIDLGLLGQPDIAALRRAVQDGAQSGQYRAACAALAEELCGRPLPDGEFYEALCGMLAELGCCLDLDCLAVSTDTRLMALEWLVSEALAGRVMEQRIGAGAMAMPSTCPPLSSSLSLPDALRQGCEALALSPPVSGNVSSRLTEMLDSLKSIAVNLGAEGMAPVLQHPDLTDREWAIVAVINDTLLKDYACRRRTLLIRFQVTLKCFDWVEKPPWDPKSVTALRVAFLQTATAQPAVQWLDLLSLPAARLAGLVDDAFAERRMKVKAVHKAASIGPVPDRGGRTNTYNFEQRVFIDVAKTNAQLKAQHGQGPAQMAQRGYGQYGKGQPGPGKGKSYGPDRHAPYGAGPRPTPYGRPAPALYYGHGDRAPAETRPYQTGYHQLPQYPPPGSGRQYDVRRR